MPRSHREFLPAALEVLETPASPVGRAVALLICAVLGFAILWSYWAHVDVVVVAEGRTIASSRLQQVQAADAGVVREIHVRDGDVVSAGDLLISLDPTESDADLEELRAKLSAVRIEAAAARALAAEDPLAAFDPPSDAPPVLLSAARLRLRDEWDSRRAELAAYDAAIAERLAEIEALRATLAKTEFILAPLEERLRMSETLLASRNTPKSAHLVIMQDRNEALGDVGVLRAQIDQFAASVTTLQAQKNSRNAQLRAALSQVLTDALETEQSLAQQIRKLQRQRRIQEIRAPASGQVQQLSIHTVGGVVSPGQTIMAVAPLDAPLEIEALILNKDIGLVEEGMPVEIKLEAFPFTRYGLIEGKVRRISRDAVEDERAGLVYAVQVEMFRSRIETEDGEIELSPGLVIQAEIRTGERRVLDYFLSPFVEYGHEALRER